MTDWSDEDWLQSQPESTEEQELREEAESQALEQLAMAEFAQKIEAGQRPNQKDIAVLLRYLTRAEIPQTIREYIAKILMNELKGSQRNSILTKDGKFQRKINGAEIFTRAEYQSCINNGLTKEQAFNILAKANLLNIHDLIDYKEIEKRWNGLSAEKVKELEPHLEKETNRISRIVYPRNR